MLGVRKPESIISHDGTLEDDTSTAGASTLSTLKTKLTRVLSGGVRESPKKSPPPQQATLIERSQSRGRDSNTLQSTGRGGAGNFKRSESVSRDAVTRLADGDERGRDVSPQNPERVTHSGRGGAGNVRSPSRDPATILKELQYEREVIEAHKNLEGVHISSGRGGAGNISHSPGRPDGSRSRSRDPAPGGRYQSTGRGGAGNLRSESIVRSGAELGRLEEEERSKLTLKEEAAHPLHSTGRGGAANITDRLESTERHPTIQANEIHPGEPHSSGRGGAGNITGGLGSRDVSTERGRPTETKPTTHGLGGLWNKLHHHEDHPGVEHPVEK